MASARPTGFSVPELPAPSPRRTEIVNAARQILDEEGRAALTMRHLAERVGMQAPSLYKHFPDKAAVEAALIDAGFVEIEAAFREAIARDGASLAALAGAYRTFALSSPHLYRLMTEGQLPRERLRPGVEAAAAAPLLEVCGDPDLARAVWAFAHGMTILELDGRFPLDADLNAAWMQGVAAFDTIRDRAVGS
jgi:AcrR family transcriptional regulator